MLIAQITDLHVVAHDQLCYGRVATNAQLQEVIAHINTLMPRPDVVIASGDLTDHGTPEEYAALRDLLRALLPPVYLIPGNHDHRDVFLKAFADHAYLPHPGAPFAQYAIEEYPVRLVGLDTTILGRAHGELCAERLAWLEATLHAEPQRPTVIFMHHPPFRTGIRGMDAFGLYGGRQMEAIVARHAQVVRVICGHIHRSIQVAWGGTIACTAPSTCHQVALNLQETETRMIDLVLEPRAVQLHLLDARYGLVSHLSYVGGDYETFSPVTAFRGNRTPEELREMVQHNYEALRRTEYEV
jgi:3',5'-cyclic AMP phosphodiesterase CpdA